MTCRSMKSKSGFTAVVCTRGARARPAPCQEQHCSRPHTKLCDYPVTRKGKPGTCDRKLCDGHAVAVGSDRDYCQAHARAKPAPPSAPKPQQGTLPGFENL